jgi:uncharacterized membrane protein
MGTSQSDAVFTLLFVLWGAITVVLVVLLGYLATLPSQGSQDHVGATLQDQNRQEKALIARGSLLTGEIIVLSVLSGVLLFICAGSSIYQGLTSF